MGIFSIFGFGSNKLLDALRKGAVILDIRTAHEFDEGKVPGSINIPVDRIPTNLLRLRGMEKTIVIYGASGELRQKAINVLKASGIEEVINGGSMGHMLRVLRHV